MAHYFSTVMKKNKDSVVENLTSDANYALTNDIQEDNFYSNDAEIFSDYITFEFSTSDTFSKINIEEIYIYQRDGYFVESLEVYGKNAKTDSWDVKNY